MHVDIIQLYPTILELTGKLITCKTSAENNTVEAYINKLDKMREFTGPILFIVWIILNVASVTFSQKIHEEMSVKERAEIFHSPDDNIPDYEIVPIHWPRIHTRDVQRIFPLKFKAFGENIEIFLNPTDGVLAGPKTPIYFAQKTTNGSKIIKYQNAMRHIINKKPKKVYKKTDKIDRATMTEYQELRHLVEELYDDSSSQSTLAVGNLHNGQRRITGMIGSKNLTIRSIPERLVKKITKLRRSLDGIDKSDYDDYHYHIIYKINSTNLINPLINPSSSNRSKRYVPDVIYPEILVVVDHDFFKLFDNRVYKIIPYLLTLWNGVDMNYRNLKNPKYRLNIAGIVLAKDSEALEYMAAHRYSESEFYSFNALLDFGKWLFKHDQYISVESYDIAVTITSSKLCGKSKLSCAYIILGQAFPSGACVMSKIHKTMNKVMIVRDDADYEGVIFATHELGHALGAVHDINGDNDTLCRYKDGYIMSDYSPYTEYSSDWSDCSLSNFTKFLNNNVGECLYNKPDKGKLVTRFLPGQMMDANKQCQNIQGTNVYKIDETICHSLPCLYAGKLTEYEDTGIPALDGTRCGKGKLCFHQQCVSTSKLHNKVRKS